MIICPADSVLSSSNKQIPVVSATLPPDRQVRVWLAQLEPLKELGVPEGLFPHFAQELDAVQSPGSAFLGNGLDEKVWVHEFFF